MTKKPQKRDNHYYLERLRVDHPGIHADLLAGRFKTPAEAFVAAGLRKSKTALDLLRSAWSKASATERDAFKGMIGCIATRSSAVILHPSFAAAVVPTTASPKKGMGHLAPTLASEVRAIMDRRNLKVGDVMHELGVNRLNASLGRALHRGDKVQNDLITALEAWADRNKTP